MQFNLRRKWYLRVYKLLHDQVTSSAIRTRNSKVNNNANLCVHFLQLMNVLNFARIKIQNSSYACSYYMRNSWNTQITIHYWHGSTTTVATSSTQPDGIHFLLLSGSIPSLPVVLNFFIILHWAVSDTEPIRTCIRQKDDIL